VETAAALFSDPLRLATTYKLILEAARAEGITLDRLPDFLGSESNNQFYLLGQDELAGEDIESAVESQLRRVAGRMGGASEAVTERLLLAAVRIGQHRFAGRVLDNYGHSCGFCGMRPGPELERRGLLVASHIKPWRVSTSAERLDPANGIAACPTHDAAFDGGLLWVNGGLRIHRTEKLLAAARAEPTMETSFGRPPIADSLQIPADSEPPGRKYLDWHRAHVVAA
jgi:putative restriction endonuclease